MIYIDQWLLPLLVAIVGVFVGAIRWGKDPNLELLIKIDHKIDHVLESNDTIINYISHH